MAIRIPLVRHTVRIGLHRRAGSKVRQFAARGTDPMVTNVDFEQWGEYLSDGPLVIA